MMQSQAGSSSLVPPDDVFFSTVFNGPPSANRHSGTDLPRHALAARTEPFGRDRKSAKKVRHAKKTKSKSKAASHPRRARGASRPKRSAPRKWSRRVTERSDALDLKRGVFKLK